MYGALLSIRGKHALPPESLLYSFLPPIIAFVLRAGMGKAHGGSSADTTVKAAAANYAATDRSGTKGAKPHWLQPQEAHLPLPATSDDQQLPHGTAAPNSNLDSLSHVREDGSSGRLRNLHYHSEAEEI